MWSSASSKELRMSLPITAVGPLKVETKPILMVSPANAGPESARLDSESAMAPASQYAVFILVSPPRYLLMPAGRSPVAGCFVREIADCQQARSRAEGLEPSAQVPARLLAGCTIIRSHRGRQE